MPESESVGRFETADPRYLGSFINADGTPCSCGACQDARRRHPILGFGFLDERLFRQIGSGLEDWFRALQHAMGLCPGCETFSSSRADPAFHAPCAQCPDCCPCETCAQCNACNPTVRLCSNCEYCVTCCGCVECARCERRAAPDDLTLCDQCERCNDCCNCPYCEPCDSTADPDRFCHNCDGCYDHCNCGSDEDGESVFQGRGRSIRLVHNPTQPFHY